MWQNPQPLIFSDFESYPEQTGDRHPIAHKKRKKKSNRVDKVASKKSSERKKVKRNDAKKIKNVLANRGTAYSGCDSSGAINYCPVPYADLWQM
jgi:hypothetical protein